MPRTAALPAGAVEPRASEVVATPTASAPALLSREGLLTQRPMVTKDVVLPNRGPVRVGEIRQRQKEEIDHLATTRIGDKVTTDYRLYMPRMVAAALVNPDGSPMFPDYEKAAGQLADTLTPAEMALLFEAAAEINAATREAREALGKDSGATPDDDS
jgi:hypothetical protein